MTTVQHIYKTEISYLPETLNFEENFRNTLLKAVDEALSLLGESAKQSIYFHLKNSYGIEKNEIPEKIKEFEDALEDIFGFGSKILLIKIMEKLHQKIGGEIKMSNNIELHFTEYVKAAAKKVNKNI